MICCFCHEQSEQEDAIECGWIPAFWTQEKEWEGPVCVPCTTKHLFFMQEHNDFELLPGHDLPELAIALTNA